MPVGFTQQVTVLTSNYSTEFGRTGNGIFNLTSRSGGNQLRGEVFYLTRPGPSIDASSPFPQRDLSGNEVQDGFQRNQGGFVLGGPLVRDKTFFLVDAEYTRDRKDNLLSSPELGVAETVRGHNDFLYLSGKVDQRWNDRWTSSVRLNVGRVTIEQTRRRPRRRRDLPVRRQLPGPRLGPGRGQDVLRGQRVSSRRRRSSTRGSAGTTGGR